MRSLEKQSLTKVALRHLLAAACILCVWSQSPASAAPFAETFSVTQPDGTQIELWGEGDEFYSIFETLDGYTVAVNPDTGFYHYAELSDDGEKLLPAGPRVTGPISSEIEVPQHLRISPEAMEKQISEKRAIWDQQIEVWRAKFETSAQESVQPLLESEFLSHAESESQYQTQSEPTSNTIVGLTILVDFSDATATVSRVTLVGLLNDPTNSSVRKYYADNSGGLLTYTNLVTAYVRVTRSKADYDSIGNPASNLAIDAIVALKALPNYTTTILPTFDCLTTNASTNVFCSIFYAGGTSPSIGASMSAIGPAALGNGYSVYGYTVQPIGSSPRINTFCHESGHMVFDFPDLYDGTSVSVGAGGYCLMSHGGNYTTPGQICAYLKYKAGWAHIIDIDSGSFLAAKVGAQGSTNFNHFYRYKKPGVDTEYFLIENRQKTGQDVDLPGCGVLVWHIDELGNNSRPNLLPNNLHDNYETTLVQADNLWHLQRKTNFGDVYDPYYSGNTASAYTNYFNDFTAPTANWWDGTPSMMHLGSFSINKTDMTFQVGEPGPYVISTNAALVRESFTPTNNTIDPYETVSLRFAFRNAGFSPSTNAVATLLAYGGVTSPSGAQSLGTLAAQADTSATFTFTANAPYGSNITAVIKIQEGSMVYGYFTNKYLLNPMNSFWAEDFDSVTAPALPSGWTNVASVQPWRTTTTYYDTSLNSAFIPEYDNVKGTSALYSAVFAIPSTNIQLRFRHNYNTAHDVDYIGAGGMLLIKIGTNPWLDIITAGGSWYTNGYNATITTGWGNPLQGRSCWGGYSGGFITTIVNLPASTAGNNVQFYWLYGTDLYPTWGGGVGWYIDSVSLGSGSAVNVSPVLEVTPGSCNFGTVTVGQSNSASFLAVNTGSQTMTGTVSVAAPFSILSGNSFSINAGQTGTVNVAFAPSTSGAYPANLLFNSPGIITTSPILDGTGISLSPPVANFSASPSSGLAPLAVTFTDTSTGNITNRFWNFGDGVTTNISGTTVSHIYQTASTNTVALTVSGPDGANTLTRSGYISAILNMNTLQVVSPCGPVAPPPGIYTNVYGTVLNNSAVSSCSQGGTQFVCAGWSMAGNAPAAGATNSFTMNHTNNAVLTWLWAPLYAPPQVDNSQGAGSLAVFSANLRGTLVGGVSADIKIYVGINDAGATAAGWSSNMVVGVVTQGNVFSATVTGLDSDTSYTYRCFASNAMGTAWSSASTFRTLIDNTKRVIPYKDSFETYALSSSIAGTNGWLALMGSVALVTNGRPDVAESGWLAYSPTNLFPLQGSNHLQVVKLDGASGSLTNRYAPATAPKVWVDMMIKPEFMGEGYQAPDISTNSRASFFFNSSGYLVNSCGNPVTLANVWTTNMIPQVSSNQWVRLTVCWDYSEAHGIDYYSIRLDGMAITSSVACANTTDENPPLGGIWFMAANHTNTGPRPRLGSVVFSGSAYLDDFVVATNAVNFGNLFWTITVASLPNWVGASFVAPSGTFTVADGAALVITNSAQAPFWSNAYCVINGLTSAPAATMDLSPVTGDINYLNCFAAVRAVSNVPYWWLADNNLTNAMTFDQASTNDADGDGFANWFEYRTSTDPGDSNSIFRIREYSRLSGTNYLRWLSACIDPELPPFGLQYSTNLMTQPFTNVVSGGNELMLIRSPTNIWAIPDPVPVGPGYYRVVAP